MIKEWFRRKYMGLVTLVSDRTFGLWQALGFHVTPNRFYWPIPDTRTLKDDLWKRVSGLPGIDLNEVAQLELLSKVKSKFKNKYDAFPAKKTGQNHEYYLNNGGFEGVDAEMLYCVIRYFKPRKMIEIGSGFSTLLSAKAILENAKESSRICEFTAIEPYPNKTLKKGIPGLSRAIIKRVQDVPLSEFNALGENDILFIDSSHILAIGGDVQYEYLEILPRLKRGVIVHCHDIFLPAEYKKEWVMKKHHFWTEQYLLQAFLAFNDSFEVLWAGNFMNLTHPDKLEESFGSYKKGVTMPGSFWMRKIK